MSKALSRWSGWPGASRTIRVAFAAAAIATGVPFGATAAGADASPASAAQATEWRMVTEYPASSMPGLGVQDFADRVRRATDGALIVKPAFDGPDGLRSAGMLDAVQQGKVQTADAFAGALAAKVPIFGLSSLPFVAGSAGQAKALLERARPAYEQALEQRGQRLLYTTPWPASGIWSRQPIDGAAALQGLRIRTYDDASQAVMQRAGARAEKLSFADAMPKISAGEIDAVLSSGDGGAGRKLWQHLPHFTQIDYAMPISIATVSLASWQAMAPSIREAVVRAAAETEAAQWARLETRLTENYANMRNNGVTIRQEIPADLQRALRNSASEVVDQWERDAGPEGAALLRGAVAAR